MNFLPKAALFIAVSTVAATATAEPSPRLTDYHHGKPAALSITCDDGFRQQVRNTCEILDPLGIKATFFLIPTAMEGPGKRDNVINWQEAITLQAAGHELGTHGTIAHKLHEATPDELEQLVNGAWQTIGERTGVAPVSYAAPGGSKFTPAVIEKVKEHHYFARNRNLLPNAKVLGYGSAGRREWTDEKTRSQIGSAIENGQWVIPVVHAIVEGWSPFKSKEEFRIHCEWLKSQQDTLWIAPMGTVGRYVMARADAKLTVDESREDRSVLSVALNSLPLDQFSAPLTVEVPKRQSSFELLPPSTTLVRSPKPEDAHLLIEVVPNGQPVTILWQNGSR